MLQLVVYTSFELKRDQTTLRRVNRKVGIRVKTIKSSFLYMYSTVKFGAFSVHYLFDLCNQRASSIVENQGFHLASGRSIRSKSLIQIIDPESRSSCACTFIEYRNYLLVNCASTSIVSLLIIIWERFCAVFLCVLTVLQDLWFIYINACFIIMDLYVDSDTMLEGVQLKN